MTNEKHEDLACVKNQAIKLKRCKQEECLQETLRYVAKHFIPKMHLGHCTCKDAIYHRVFLTPSGYSLWMSSERMWNKAFARMGSASDTTDLRTLTVKINSNVKQIILGIWNSSGLHSCILWLDLWMWEF